jgi:hypothetical protein
LTFCGDLLFVPSGINHHLFENLRRKGHHCHGRKRLSGGRPQKFLPAFGQKVLRDVHFTPGLAETVVAVYAPGDRGLNRCRAPDTTTGRDPPQRRRARARNGVAPYIPAAFCRDAGSAGHGATRRRDRSGRCKPGVLRQGWKPVRAETASLAPFTTARPARGTPGKAINRRRKEGTGRRTTVTVISTVTTET